jgi:two-component system sensor histidine kinase TtrS
MQPILCCQRLVVFPCPERRCGCHARNFLLICCLFWTMAPAWGGDGNGKPLIRIGILAYRGPAEAVESWSDLAKLLTAAIPDHRFEQAYLDGPSLREAVRAGQIDFVLTNPGQYVSLAAEFGIRRIVTLSLPESLSPEQALGSAVIARSSRGDLVNLVDLRGLRLAAVAPDAFGGYLAAARELHNAGLDPDSGHIKVSFVGFPMQRAVEAVRDGSADAAIVRTCLVEQLAARGLVKAEEFKILAPRSEPGFQCATSTPLYPDWPFAALRHGDRELAKAVTVALLSMPPAANGLSWGVPADYQAVHDLYQEQMSGPYAGIAGSTLRGLLKRHRPYVILALVVLVGFLAHVVRVEYLVKRRSAELGESQARERRLQQDAEHMARLSILGEMASTLAHEINQPLATISTYAQSLDRRLAGGQIDAGQFAQASREIAGQAERAAEVVRRIRAFSRKRESVRENKPLCETVREATTLFSGLLPELPPVVLEDQLPSGTRIDADHVQLQQVLLNLLKNAADAMSALPLRQRSIAVRCDRHDGRLRIRVADCGPAVPADTMARLFEPFFTTKADGLGLGLAICKSIAEAHGGRLTVEAREPPPGLVFTLSLPDHAEHV